jgi:hypothetical protein
VVRVIRSNLPLLLPIAGAGSAFLLNLFLKSNLSASDYGDFAALLLVVSALFMIGAMGFDDVLIRLLEVSNGQVLVRNSLVFAGGGVLLVAPLVSYSLLKMVGVVQDFDTFFLGCSFFVPASMLVGTLFKVKGDVTSFYMMNSAWKVILLLFFLAAFVLNIKLSYPLSIVVSVMLGFALSMFLTERKGVCFCAGDSRPWRVLVYMSASFISIVGYAFFDLLDRFVIREVFTSAEFGDYYFIFTFILSPVGIVAYYFSTKQLALYKMDFNLARFRLDFSRVALLSFLLALFFSLIICVAVYFGILSFVVNYRVLLFVVVVLAVIRGGYAIVSMAYSVVCSSRSLMVVGVLFFAITVLVYYIISTYFNVGGFIYCAAVFPVLWLARLLVYWVLIGVELRARV